LQVNEDKVCVLALIQASNKDGPDVSHLVERVFQRRL